MYFFDFTYVQFMYTLYKTLNYNHLKEINRMRFIYVSLIIDYRKIYICTRIPTNY